MTAGPAASRRVGINGRTSPPPDSSLPKVCSFQLPKVCSFRLPLTTWATDTSCDNTRERLEHTAFSVSVEGNPETPQDFVAASTADR